MKHFRTLNYLKESWSLVVLMVLISSSALAQEISHDFEQQLNEKTITFEAVNPYTKLPGIVTITVSGTFSGKRVESGRKAGWSTIKGNQRGSFEFVPYDSSQPTFKGTFKFGLVGEIPADRHNDVLQLDFLVKTVGTDGSQVTFIQSERATVNEYVADVSFGDLKQLDVETQESSEPKP